MACCWLSPLRPSPGEGTSLGPPPLSGLVQSSEEFALTPHGTCLLIVLVRGRLPLNAVAFPMMVRKYPASFSTGTTAGATQTTTGTTYASSLGWTGPLLPHISDAARLLLQMFGSKTTVSRNPLTKRKSRKCRVRLSRSSLILGLKSALFLLRTWSPAMDNGLYTKVGQLSKKKKRVFCWSIYIISLLLELLFLFATLNDVRSLALTSQS